MTPLKCVELTITDELELVSTCRKGLEISKPPCNKPVSRRLRPNCTSVYTICYLTVVVDFNEL